MKTNLFVLSVCLCGLSASATQHHYRSIYPFEFAEATTYALSKREAAPPQGRSGRSSSSGGGSQRAPAQGRSASRASSSDSDSSGWSSDETSSGQRKAHAKIRVTAHPSAPPGRGGEIAKFTDQLSNMDYNEVSGGQTKKKRISGPDVGVTGTAAYGGSLRAKARGSKLTYQVDTTRGGTAKLKYQTSDSAPVTQRFPPGVQHSDGIKHSDGVPIDAKLKINGPGLGTLVGGHVDQQ